MADLQKSVPMSLKQTKQQSSESRAINNLYMERAIAVRVDRLRKKMVEGIRGKRIVMKFQDYLLAQCLFYSQIIHH